MLTGIKNGWKTFYGKHPAMAQFIIFFIVSNGVTVLQLVLMPVFRTIFETTSLVHQSFQIGQIGSNPDGTPYYIFNYAAGTIGKGGGGGLAYFLAVEITMAIAQIINFFLQRSVTFKASNSVRKAAMWYVIAYIIITIGAAALQGLYKAPIYDLFMNRFNLLGNGETIADVITMLINSAISFWVFFPIFRIIFKDKEA
ncbi:hypothetical protein [Clostridium sp. E02]|uniref:hypothetical protein n=1 Tax=Clostridium sp. E02 TaxID=2487134 RepID=UPI000F51CE1E|nr:hypothetical protein [Clostridium sp. E02]